MRQNFCSYRQKNLINHKNYNFLNFDFDFDFLILKIPFSTNSLPKLLSDSLISDSLILDSLLSDSSISQSHPKL